MYGKMIMRNMKRSRKDYLIYILTLIFCVGLFYAYMALSSRNFNPSLGEGLDFASVRGNMTVPILAITAILLFLIKYVNDYMIKRKQKEFAIQTILGMEQKTTAKLFFIETLAIGAFATGLGIILGCFISQLITAMLLNAFDQPFKFTFPLYIDTLAWTLLFFSLAFGLIGFLNIRFIQKIKIIDMLQANRKTETDYKHSSWMPVWLICATLMSIFMLSRGVSIFLSFYSVRLPVNLQFSLYGNLISSAFFILTVAYWGLSKSFSNRMRFNRLLEILILSSFLIIFFSFRVAQSSHVTFNSSIEFAAILFFTAFSVCSLFYLINDWIAYWKHKSPKLKYTGENLFLLGQIMARLKTTSKTMSVICLALMASMFLFTLEPIMTGWMSGHLEHKSNYDIQIYSRYNQIRDTDHLAKTDYHFVPQFLESHGIRSAETHQFNSYFIRQSDFLERNKYRFPMLAISLSDYNRLRIMNELDPVGLGPEEYTTQWSSLASKDEMSAFADRSSRLNIGSAELILSSIPVYQDSLGPYLYNTYTEAVYVLPDRMTEKLMPANQFLFINTKQPLTYKDAEQLDLLFINTVRSPDEKTGNTSEIRLSTLQINDSTAGQFSAKAILNYTGVVLLIICFTVLSLQQLSDSSEFRYRFGILRNMGISERQLNMIILKQMGVWFGTPVLMAFIINLLFMYFIVDSLYTELSAYIGIQNVVTSSIAALSIVAVLLSCYFISTWVLFKRNISA